MKEWAVLYSGTQKSFHVELLCDAVAQAKDRLLRAFEDGDESGGGNDWVIVGIAEGQREAGDVCRVWQQMRDKELGRE